MSYIRTRVGQTVQIQTIPSTLNLTVIITTTVILVILICIVYYNGRKNVENERSLLEVSTEKLNKYQKKPIRTFINFFSSVLPVDYKLSATKLFWLKLCTEHDLISLKTQYIKDQSTITVKWLQLSCKVITYLVLNSALNIHLYGDHDQCTSYTNENTCGSIILVSLVTNSLCQWNEANNTCRYQVNNDPADWFLNTMILVVVMLLVQAVIGRFMRFLITHGKVCLQHGACPCLSSASSQWSTTGRHNDPLYNTFEGGAQNIPTNKNNNHIKSRRVGSKHQSSRVVPFDSHYLSEEQKEQCAKTDYGERLTSTAVLDPTSLEEYGMSEYGDELKRCQTRKTTLIRGVCFAIMRQRMDYISPEREVGLMLADKIHKWSWILLPSRTLKDNTHDINYVNSWKYTLRAWYYSHYDISDPTRCSKMVAHGHLFNHELLVDRLIRNRQRATIIRAAVMRIKDEEQQDVYLIQQFLTQSMVGYRRKVLEALLFHPEEIAIARLDRLGVQYLALFVVPLYLILGLLYVAFYGVRVDRHSSSIWLTALLVVLCEDLLCLQPAKIFIRHVWIPRLAHIEYTALHTILATRAHTILTRNTGLLRNINSVVQHYHPVCRVARLAPHLASSRILLSLTDYDLPVRQLLDRLKAPFVAGRIVRFDARSPLVFDCVATLKDNFVTRWLIVKNFLETAVEYTLGVMVYALLCLPEWLQHMLMDCCGAIGLNAVIIGLFLLAVHVSVIAAALVCFVILFIAFMAVYFNYCGKSLPSVVDTVNTSLNSSPRGSVKRKKGSRHKERINQTGVVIV